MTDAREDPANGRVGAMRTKTATTTACLAVLATVAVLPMAVAPRRAHLVGEAILQHALRLEGPTVGGLSGVDYDPRTGRWVLISDHTGDPRRDVGRAPVATFAAR